jgi:hypothetical protein
LQRYPDSVYWQSVRYNISGVSEGEEQDCKTRPDYTEQLHKNPLHKVQGYPFFPLNPAPETKPSHREWWTPKLQHLLDALHERGVANPALALAQSLFAVEYFPYRSSSTHYMPGGPALVLSQGYSNWLVRQAMKNKALIVVRYGKNQWFKAVEGLDEYEGLLLLKGTQQNHLSPKGFVNPDGFKLVVGRIVSALSLI